MKPKPGGIRFVLFFVLLSGSTPVSAQLKANFSISNTSGCSPLTVSFSDKTSGGKSPYTYSWDFGNSNTSTQQNPGATYYLSGTYKVTLKVTDKSSGTDTISKFVTVYTP